MVYTFMNLGAFLGWLSAGPPESSEKISKISQADAQGPRPRILMLISCSRWRAFRHRRFLGKYNIFLG